MTTYPYNWDNGQTVPYSDDANKVIHLPELPPDIGARGRLEIGFGIALMAVA
jgi:hypothetical protein